jgi:drug/metabolite transporter (DMT)-like permease
MMSSRSRALAALAAAGSAWGTSVPLSKIALGWLDPGWLAAARFGLAALVMLAIARREELRRAFRWPVLAAGAAGWGGTVLVQNAGVERTSVTHASLLIGTAPVLVAVLAAAWHRAPAPPLAWAGFAVSLAGVAIVAAGSGGGATAGGDALVLASVAMSAAVTVAQPRLLQGCDVLAVTAVQFTGAALVALPAGLLSGGVPAAPPGAGDVLAVAALAAAGTIVPFSLFCYGQRRVPAEIAGAFLNLEPLVGAIAGITVLGDPAGARQLAGGAAILAGIALSSIPAFSARAAHRPGPAGDEDRRGLAAGPPSCPGPEIGVRSPGSPPARVRRPVARLRLRPRAQRAEPGLRAVGPGPLGIQRAAVRGLQAGDLGGAFLPQPGDLPP